MSVEFWTSCHCNDGVDCQQPFRLAKEVSPAFYFFQKKTEKWKFTQIEFFMRQRNTQRLVEDLQIDPRDTPLLHDAQVHVSRGTVRPGHGLALNVTGQQASGGRKIDGQVEGTLDIHGRVFDALPYGLGM